MHSRDHPEKKSGQYIRRSRMTKGDAAVTRGARTPTTPEVEQW